MKELYRLAGVVFPMENCRGFGAPYYIKNGDNKTRYYVNARDGCILKFFEQPYRDKIEYFHYSINEEHQLIGVGDKPHVVVMLRDVNKKEHILVGMDMADVCLKIVELFKQYLLDTEAFLWAEREKYLLIKDKIDECFIRDVLKRMIDGRNNKVCLEQLSSENWSDYWNRHVLPMYGKSIGDMVVYCYKDKNNIEYLVIFIKDNMSLHIHRLATDNDGNHFLIGSKFCNTSDNNYNDFKGMIEEKYHLRLHWGC